jgi:hypothetical protein
MGTAIIKQVIAFSSTSFTHSGKHDNIYSTVVPKHVQNIISGIAGFPFPPHSEFLPGAQLSSVLSIHTQRRKKLLYACHHGVYIWWKLNHKR